MHEHDARWRDFYDRLAPWYDPGIELWSRVWGFRDSAERRKMVGRLNLTPGDRVLEVSVGTGRNLPFIYEQVGPAGCVVALDVAPRMLHRCRERLRKWDIAAHLIEGDATRLPFASNTFDAVLHFGAINEFSNRRGAIEEMVRVARPGACVVIGDEGLRPEVRRSIRGRLLLRVNPYYAHLPPVEELPPDAQDVGLSWFRGDACYLLAFRKP